MIDLTQRIEAMTRNVIAAAIHHDMWSLQIQDTAWKQTVIYREKYQNLWSANSLAHRYSFYIRIASAYIEHRKSNNILRLRRDLNSNISIEKGTEIDSMIADAIPLFKKIEKLRNNIYAHQSANQTIAEVYGDAQISLDDARKLVLVSMDIMNEYRRTVGLQPAETNDAHIKEFFASIAVLEFVS
jgi:hypothetical protein